jgi:hypothetical protein
MEFSAHIGIVLMSLPRFRVGDLIKIKGLNKSIGLVIRIDNEMITVSWFLNGYIGMVSHVCFDDLEKVKDGDFTDRFSDKSE